MAVQKPNSSLIVTGPHLLSKREFLKLGALTAASLAVLGFAPRPPGSSPRTDAQTGCPSSDMLTAFTDKDREVLAGVGNLHTQPKWQEILKNADPAYTDWTGIALPVQVLRTVQHLGLFADNTFRPMPKAYTPEKNPITQAAWPDRDFPPGYFFGVQPLNAPKMVDGASPILFHEPIQDRNIIPYDVVAKKGTQVYFAQGSRVELDNGKQTFNQPDAFVISFDLGAHGHLTKGAWDLMYLPESLSPDAQQLIGYTWLNGVRGETAGWQPAVHGGDYNHANTYEVTGDASTDLVVTPLWTK